MQISVTARSGEFSDGVKDYAAKKLKKLERILPKIDSVQITETKERAWHIVEITVTSNSLLVRSQERSDDMRSAIDGVVDKLERQIKKYRTKLQNRSRHIEDEEALAQAGEGDEETGRIVRSKRFAIKPMDPNEAAAEMELLGHDFYVFSNAITNQVNVIYRRQDGHYGLIEPDF